MIEASFKLLRKNFRKSGKEIIDHIISTHFDPWNISIEDNICVFCNALNELSKEHVIPRWVYENDPSRSFQTVINNTSQSFHKAVIPCCETCNNETLSEIEKHMKRLFQETDLNREYYEYPDVLNIIRWLEIIDYKFQVLNFRRKYLRKDNVADPEHIFKNVPLAIMRPTINLSPSKALSGLRKSQKRIQRKDKESRYYSLVLWKNPNTSDLFFNNMGQFIFFGFKQFGLSLFYFYEEEFLTNHEAEQAAKKIIQQHY